MTMIFSKAMITPEAGMNLQIDCNPKMKNTSIKFTLMKFSYSYIIAVSLITTLFTSCSEEELIKGTPLPVGSEILFGVDAKAEGTRTYYGSADVSIDGATTWNIFWNYGENDKDHIYVFSPQASSDHNQAEYIVNAATAETNANVACIKAGESGLMSGSEDKHDFYAAYPASNVKQGQCSQTKIKMTMPIRQTAQFVGYDNENTTVLPEPTTGVRHYKMEPDMSCALMVAQNTGVTLEKDKAVGLPFKALATCLDITINGGVEDINEPERISSIVVEGYKEDGETPANIAGDFTYDFSDGSINYDTSTGSTATNKVVISTLAPDKEGDAIGVPLMLHNTMNVKVFILHDAEVRFIKVRVFNKQFKYYTKTLVMDRFEDGQISIVDLPRNNPDAASVDYSVWLSQLDPCICISELSLPGSQFAFSYLITDDDSEETQTETFTHQMHTGSRVFHTYVGLGTDNVPCIVTSKGDVVRPGGSEITLDYVISEMAKELKENHSDEFCVLALSDCVDYYVNHTDELVPLMTGVKQVLEKHADDLATNISANTTISDVKGKIIVKYQLNGSTGRSNGDAVTNDQINALLEQISNWSNMDGAPCLFNWFSHAYNSHLAYDPMIFGNIGSFEISGSFKSEYKNYRYIYESPVLNDCKPGIALTAANILLKNKTENWGSWNGDINMISKPIDSDFDINSNTWLIFAENSTISGNESVVKLVPEAISDTYNRDAHNKFYMTFLGGTGSPISGTNLISAWTAAVSNGFTNKPFGWVLFNQIGSSKDRKDPVNVAVSAIIEHNTTEWKLKRNTDSNQSQNLVKHSRLLIVRR